MILLLLCPNTLLGLLGLLSYPLLLLYNIVSCPLIRKLDLSISAVIVVGRVGLLARCGVTPSYMLFVDVEVGAGWQTPTLNLTSQEGSEGVFKVAGRVVYHVVISLRVCSTSSHLASIHSL